MDDVANSLYRDLRGGIEIKNPERLFGPVVIVAYEVGNEAACVAQSLGFGETVVRPSELQFRLLSVFDVDHQAIPINDAAFRVIKRLSDRLNPSILTVRPPESIYILVRRPCGG